MSPLKSGLNVNFEENGGERLLLNNSLTSKTGTTVWRLNDLTKKETVNCDFFFFFFCWLNLFSLLQITLLFEVELRANKQTNKHQTKINPNQLTNYTLPPIILLTFFFFNLMVNYINMKCFKH